MRAIGVCTVLVAILYVHCEDYVKNQADGKAYKLMYRSQKWRLAKEECEKESAKLAVPKSQDEFQFIQKLVRGMYYPNVTGTSYKLLVWLGINNLEDYRVWKNIDGENIDDTGFNTWASDDVRYSDDPRQPHCAGMDAANPGLRYYWCERRQPYVCQIQFRPSV